jgi:transcriptional regulator with XRE-family HTH domain
MQPLDKQAMGRRIRQIRLAAGLRQWELAKRLGTTQSAIHKYEHGVVPEPRRLVELARIGGTSLEWVLTGRHWENGSETQERVSTDLLEMARRLEEIGSGGLTRVGEALDIVRAAVGAIEAGDEGQLVTDGHVRPACFAGHSAETLALLETAWRIQRAVLNQVARATHERLDGSLRPEEAEG